MKQFSKFAAVLLIAQTILLGVTVTGKTVFCYYGTWSYYRPGDGKFQPSDINPQLCTHIGYAFFGLTDDGRIHTLDQWLDVDLGTIAKVIALKQQNPNLKVLASLGGWNEGSTKYSSMAADANKRATFVSSVLSFLAQYGFDGLDLDWEYPAQRGGSAADKQNFVTLLQQLKQSFASHNYLLTIAVGASSTSASQSYNIAAVSQQVDLINVMTYDLGGSWDPVLEHNAPLYGTGVNTVQASIDYWLGQGAAANKLVLGIPMYGRSFTLANTAQTSVGSPNAGAGAAGPYTREAGYLGYNEICADASGWTRVWDANAKVPYTYKGNQWVSYDNEQSIQEKVAFLKSRNLAGAMIWSIETDDFKGICGQAYPLLRAINQYLGTDNPVTDSPNTSTSTTTSTTTTTTTKAPNTTPGLDNCQVDGTFRSSIDCTKFYTCVNGIKYDFNCPSGLYYDPSINGCNWPNLVVCNV